MTDYGSMSHQQLYDFVQSGSAGDVESAATLNANHAKSVTEATDDLQKTLTNIQSSWSGAAADQFSQQAMALVQQMQQHAQTADNTHTWMNYAGQSLGWAQQNMPSPPSQAEQDLAAINSNPVSEWGLGVLTDGASYLASKAASDDMAKKKAAATSVMTQLASAYSTANSHLTPATKRIVDGGNDGNNNGNGNSQGNQTGNGSSASNGSGNGNGSGAVIMPMPMAMPMSNSGSGSEGASARISTGSYGTGSSSSGGGSTIPASGVTDTHLPTSTVTSGIGDLPTSGVPNPTTTGVTSFGGGSTSGNGYTGGGIPGMGSPGGVNEFGGGGGGGASGLTEGEGGVGGSSRFGSGKLGGLGGGALGGEGAGGFGSTGLGGSGAGRNSALSGGTGTGELGQEAGGTGYGTQAGSGTDSAAGTSAAAAAGEAEGANSSQNNMMGGGMGGMGRGGGGGGQGERGGRASWLKEDPDYWYGDKMKDAAPPGGVIE